MSATAGSRSDPFRAPATDAGPAPAALQATAAARPTAPRTTAAAVPDRPVPRRPPRRTSGPHGVRGTGRAVGDGR
ncbi:hypothetical protein [Streptomyces sp. NPDC048663]|uniref:hypothetical protein n=1 Tax=Streptomyces sp. NPDC048663 TaxID=3155638 RepID=UPI0034371337